MLENNKDDEKLKLIEECAEYFDNIVYEFNKIRNLLANGSPEIDEGWEKTRNIMKRAFINLQYFILKIKDAGG